MSIDLKHASTGQAVREASAESKSSQAAKAYAQLRAMVMNNQLPVGTSLLELEAAAMLSMSRTPVREAMVRLANEGLVEIRPRHGMRVLPLSADDMAEIYEILTGLESVAAGKLARRGLSAEEVKSLEEPLAQMEAALASDDLEGWAAADEEFHQRLVLLAGNARLVNVTRTFMDQAHRARMATLRLRPKPVSSNRDHLALLQAIKSRNSEEARHIHYNHRRQSGDMLTMLLQHLGLRHL